MLEKTRAFEFKFIGKVLAVREDRVELEDGTEAIREFVATKDSVAVLPIHDGKVIMVTQFRYAVSTPLLEIPAGRIEKGEKPEQAAQRELKEETGYFAKDLIFLGYFFPSPGVLTERIYLYLAKDLVPMEADPDHGERITITEFEYNDIYGRIKAGICPDMKTTLAFLLAANLPT